LYRRLFQFLKARMQLSTLFPKHCWTSRWSLSLGTPVARRTLLNLECDVAATPQKALEIVRNLQFTVAGGATQQHSYGGIDGKVPGRCTRNA
jgi:hypothetical protein